LERLWPINEKDREKKIAGGLKTAALMGWRFLFFRGQGRRILPASIYQVKRPQNHNNEYNQ
jgi:hypothetical protein